MEICLMVGRRDLSYKQLLECIGDHNPHDWNEGTKTRDCSIPADLYIIFVIVSLLSRCRYLRHPSWTLTQPCRRKDVRLYHFSIAGLRSISHVKFVTGWVCNHQ